MADAGGDLMRLVETERQLDGELTAARELGAKLVADARAEIVRREQAVADEVRAGIEQARLAVERDLEQRLAAVAAEGQRAALAFDAVAPETVQSLARQLVARLVSLEPAP